MTLRWLVPALWFGLGFGAALLAGLAQHAHAAEVLGRLTTLGGAVFLLLGRTLYPQAGIAVAGTLTLNPEALLLQLAGQPTQVLSLGRDVARITIHYTGYQGEQYQRTTLNGSDNFISLNHGPSLRFWVLDESVTLDLRVILHSWYLRKISLREYCADSPTFLLTRDLSYEQI